MTEGETMCHYLQGECIINKLLLNLFLLPLSDFYSFDYLIKRMLKH